jgi:hypothetical protein
MADNKFMGANISKKPKVRVFKCDGQPVDGSLAKWVSPPLSKPSTARNSIGSIEFLQGVSELRQLIKQTIHDLDGLVGILETKNVPASKAPESNLGGVVELLKSPIVLNLLGSLLSGK